MDEGFVVVAGSIFTTVIVAVVRALRTLDQNKAAQTDLQGIVARLDTLEKENSRLRVDNAALATENQVIVKRNQHLEEANDRFNEQIGGLRAEFNRQRAAHEQEVRTLTDRVARLEDEKRSAEAEKLRLAARNVELEEAHRRNEQRIEELTADIRGLHDALTRVQAQNEALEKLFSRMTIVATVQPDDEGKTT